MTRKERVELKTLTFCKEIAKEIAAALDGPGTVEDAARRGDAFLNKCIREKPQEKSFYLNCGHRVAKEFNNILEERIKRMENAR
jgi:hypothetical protein